MRFLWCAPSLLFLLADVNCGLVEELFFSFSDPVGDQDVVHDLPIVAIDVVRLDFSFSDTTGDYSICVSSDAARPFVGSCRINVLLFNPDAGTSLDPGFLESHKDVVLDSPSITVRWAGTSPKLVSWRREDRVGLGTVAFGNPSDAPFSLFGSGVLQSVNDRFAEWKSIDYVGQDGGNNGQSTAIAPIVSNPFVLDSVDAPLTAQPNETQRTRPRPHTAPRPAHAPLAADQSHRVERPHMPVGAPRVASRARPLSDMMEDALAIGLPIAAALGAAAFTVRTARRAPPHLRTLAFGLISVSVSLFALGCSAIPFASPRLCGMVALGVSAVGTVFAVIGSRSGEPTHAIWPCIVGLAANTGVQLLAFTLLLDNHTHSIDQLEHRSRGLLSFIHSSVLISMLAIVGIRVWLWINEQKMSGQRFRFSLSSFLITSVAIPIWLGLSLVVPGSIWGDGRKLPNPGDLGELIADATNFGALSTFEVLMTPFALYAVTVVLHAALSRRRDAWPWSGLLAALILTVTLVVTA
jgi:hypothetical protein